MRLGRRRRTVIAGNWKTVLLAVTAAAALIGAAVIGVPSTSEIAAEILFSSR
jgi:hypothetical protein